jgi:hypothetical protein
VRRTALWSLERRARRGAIAQADAGELARDAARIAARERDPGVRARALFALAALDPRAAEEPLRAGLADERREVRIAATALAGEVLGAARAASLVAARAADPDPAVRAQALDSLVRLGTRDAARALVGRLEAEQGERLAWRALAGLQSLSGLRHRRDPRPWRDWAEALPADWTAASAASVADAEEAGDERSAAFAGLPILSRRVAFLIDLSGSIWKERADGKTRKQRVDQELRAALEALPEDTRFNVIPYTGDPHPWAEGLVPATPANVRKAIRDFERENAQGTGNFWDAALLALADPEVDTLVVLTDGAPTGGRRFHLDLLVPLFLELDATRKVAVDSILVGASRRLREAWAELAAGTGGRSIAIELD